jgi:glycerol-3-phosphate dehydrogenase
MIWKDIPGYEGLYQVSSDGKVRGKRGLLKCHVTKHGYIRATLWSKSKPKHFLLHRIVASVFLKNKDSKEQINHIDGDKKNNNLSNLEWSTRSENMIHSVDVLNKRTKNITIIYKHNEYSFKSYKDCAKFLNTHTSTVSSVARGVRKNKLFEIK